MKVLVIGGGGREHALVWKLRQSPRVQKIYCAPGNGGIIRDAERIPVKKSSIQEFTGSRFAPLQRTQEWGTLSRGSFRRIEGKATRPP